MADTKISALSADASVTGTEQVPLNDAGTNKRTTTADIAALAKGLPLGLTGATSATRYVGATASGAPASGTFAVGDFVITHAGEVYVCTTAGTPGTWAQIGAGGGGAIRVEDEGSSIVAAATGINFAGAGVTVTDAGSNEALVTIPGGGGGGGISGVDADTVNIWGDPISSTNLIVGTSSSVIFGGFRELSAQNAEVVWRIGPLATGTWKVSLMHSRSTDRGIATFAFSTDASSWTVVGTIDAYNSSASHNSISTVTGISVSSAISYLRITMSTKNASSSGYRLLMQALSLSRTA
jgi:hypothetical protein